MKKFWKSRTIWFNAIVAALGAAEPSLGLLKAIIPVDVYAVLMFTLVVGNTVLRTITKTELTK